MLSNLEILLDEGNSNMAVRGIFWPNFIIYKLDKHVVLLLINYIAG